MPKYRHWVQLLNDFYVYSVMHALPWAGAALLEKASKELDEIMAAIGTYLAQRSKGHLKVG